MKKIIALALALIMALSMGVVALAADYQPGEKITLALSEDLKTGKIADYDFTTGADYYKGASLIEEIKLNKEKTAVEIVLKESTKLLAEDRQINGQVTVKGTTEAGVAFEEIVYTGMKTVNNNVEYISGSKKAAGAEDIGAKLWDAANTVFVMDENGGYVSFTDGILKGVVKMDKDENAFVSLTAIDEDTEDALYEVLGEDFDAIIETYVMAGNGFKNEVAYSYKAYAEDPHYFYGFDGEKLFALDAKYDADEDVDAYVFAYTGAGVIVISDEEIVMGAEETKNPDTGANDVVGVAAALAVVSLVAAGAVSLKK